MKVPVTEAPPPGFAQRWSAWGAGSAANRANGDPAVRSATIFPRAPPVLPPASTIASTPGHRLQALRSPAAAPTGGSRRAGQRPERRPASRRSRVYAGPGLFCRRARLHQSLVHDDIALCLATSSTPNFDGQSYGVRLEGGYRLGALPTLGVTPYAALQAQRFPHARLQRVRCERRRLRARLQFPQRDRYQKRAGRALRPAAAAQPRARR